MGLAKDLAGQTFDRLTVVLRDTRAELNAGRQRRGYFWMCGCVCGNVVTVRADRLLSGKTRSCGCLPHGEYSATGKWPEVIDKTDRRHDLEIGSYARLLQEQQGACAICGGSPRPDTRLNLDHDHETEQVRGLLCSKCNIGLGYLNDDIVIVGKALNYLAKQRPALKRGPRAKRN